jgi:hypothetical protein
MAPLPVFNKDPFSSALAIMAFPDDHQKAYLCSCWIIVQGMADVLIKHQPEAAAAHIASKSAEFAQFFSEWHRRQREGVFVGTLVTTMVSLIKQDPSVASWENAMNILIDNWDEAKLSRSRLQTLRGQYASVQHILASFADSRSIHQTPSFSTKLFFTKAMRIHTILSPVGTDSAVLRNRMSLSSLLTRVSRHFSKSLSPPISSLAPRARAGQGNHRPKFLGLLIYPANSPDLPMDGEPLR